LLKETKMAIPVTHVIQWAQLHNHPVDADLYKNLGAPPKYRVFCSCQWEGLAHTEFRRDYFIECHRQAQLMRGNIVEVVLLSQTKVVSTPEADPQVEPEPTEANLDLPLSRGASAIKGLETKGE
jgi:hypothetical protein